MRIRIEESLLMFFCSSSARVLLESGVMARAERSVPAVWQPPRAPAAAIAADARSRRKGGLRFNRDAPRSGLSPENSLTNSYPYGGLIARAEPSIVLIQHCYGERMVKLNQSRKIG